MTSGLPPDAAVFRRAGTFVPPAVESVLSLPVSLVFVGTVLLSVVLRWCCVECCRCAVDRLSVSEVGRPGCDAGVRGTVDSIPDFPDAGGHVQRLTAKRPSAGHGKPLPGEAAGRDAS
jgi:hypothetical protein